jgi:hypothetical protein
MSGSKLTDEFKRDCKILFVAKVQPAGASSRKCTPKALDPGQADRCRAALVTSLQYLEGRSPVLGALKHTAQRRWKALQSSYRTGGNVPVKQV